MGNGFAYLVLLGWPLVAAALFSSRPRPEALVWTILAAFLLLPQRVEINLPMVPAFDRTLIPSLAALMLCLSGDARVPPARRGWLPGAALPRALVLVYLFGPLASVLTNGDTIHIGGGFFLAGLTLYDAVSFTVGHAVLLLPLLLGRRYLADPAAHAMLLRALMMAGLAYSLPMLFEVRMSPQLHTWIYGFFPHSFGQQMRFGGFRPVVFLIHGLVVALFTAMALVAAAAWARGRSGRERSVAMLAVAWLGVMLVLCKTVGALVLAALFLPVALLASLRQQIAVAAVTATVVLAYPMLRGSDMVPVDTALSLAASIDPARAQSLGVRFDNEAILLDRASLRPVFGWGGWGRWRVYDPATGEAITVSDGRWIITVGHYGWIGYLAEFGLLALPILLLVRQKSAAPPDPHTVGLCLVLALNMLDLLPNSGLTPLTWLVAGALLGHVEQRLPVPTAARVRYRAPVA